MDRVLFSIGSFKIYYYSVIMLLAVLVGIYVAYRESKRCGMSAYLMDLITYLIIFGIIGARSYYVIFNFDSYKDRLIDIFKIWEGGIAIYGAVIGGLIAIIYYAKKRGQNVIKTTDVIVPGLILAQAIGRWGNFFNGEAHGGVVSLDLLKEMHLPEFIINGMYIGGEYYHPTFLYESIWCIIGFMVIILLRKVLKRKTGVVTACYFIWYGIGRYFVEGLRTDSLYIGNYRVSQLVSLALVLIGIIMFVIIYIRKGGNDERKI